jgi:CheY-like chemotaxis protein
METRGRKKMKVLIVDDDWIVLESCRRVLQAEGMAVQAAADAEKAQSLLETGGGFDLILTDIKMPGKDGFELIRTVRERFPQSAILMMTGYLIPEIIQRAQAQGADAVIAKPFTPEELVASVRKTIREVQQRLPAGAKPLPD